MSSIGMVGATALGALVSRAAQSRSQKFKQDFEPLGQDPQSGSLTAEDSDYAALQKDLRQAGPGDTPLRARPVPHRANPGPLRSNPVGTGP